MAALRMDKIFILQNDVYFTIPRENCKLIIA